MKEAGNNDKGDEVREEAAPSAYKPPQEKDRDWMELASAALLSLAMIATSWCAYQAARWGGLQSISFSEAATARNLAMTYITKAGQEILVDVDVFLEYASLFIDGELSEEQLKVYSDRLFSEELNRAVEAWLATDPCPDSVRCDLRVGRREVTQGAHGLAVALEQGAAVHVGGQQAAQCDQ